MLPAQDPREGGRPRRRRVGRPAALDERVVRAEEPRAAAQQRRPRARLQRLPPVRGGRRAGRLRRGRHRRGGARARSAPAPAKAAPRSIDGRAGRGGASSATPGSPARASSPVRCSSRSWRCALLAPAPLVFAHAMRRVHRYSRVARVDLRPSQSVRLRIDRSDGQPLFDFRLTHRARGVPHRRGARGRRRSRARGYLHAIGDSYTMGWGVDAAASVSGAARAAARAGALAS